MANLRPFMALSVLGIGKSHREPSPVSTVAGASYVVVSGLKITNKQLCKNRSIFAMQKSWIVLLQIQEFSSYCFTETAYKLKIFTLRISVKNSRWTTPLKQKKTVDRTFTFNQTWCTAFGLGYSSRFHWDNWALVSTLPPFTHVSSVVMIIFFPYLDCCSLYLVAPWWYSCDGSFDQNWTISEYSPFSHVSCPKR